MAPFSRRFLARRDGVLLSWLWLTVVGADGELEAHSGGFMAQEDSGLEQTLGSIGGEEDLQLAGAGFIRGGGQELGLDTTPEHRDFKCCQCLFFPLDQHTASTAGGISSLDLTEGGQWRGGGEVAGELGGDGKRDAAAPAKGGRWWFFAGHSWSAQDGGTVDDTKRCLEGADEGALVYPDIEAVLPFLEAALVSGGE